MHVIAVVNTKGGVGKTTIAAALAVRAAQESKRVAIVDLDPQRSLIEWWKRRGRTDNPTIFEGPDTAADAVEALRLDGWDLVILDGPPAFLVTIQEMVEAADYVVIPVRASVLDLLATQDAVVLAQQAGAAFSVLINDVQAREKSAAETRRNLLNLHVPMLQSEIGHRISFVNAMAVGKSAAEIHNGRDKAAVAEIEALWAELKPLVRKAAKARASKGTPHDE